VSEQNLERARRHYDAWNGGDTEAVVALFAEDVEWHGHPRLPEPGPYRSREAVKRWMDQFQEAWGELTATPVELLDSEQDVVALVHMTGRGRGSGVEVAGGVDVHLIRFGGDEVVFFEIVPWDMAAERAGLERGESDAVVLRVRDGLDDEGIAGELGIGGGEVTSRLHGAFHKLRELGAERSPR
jgi:ketosteroid isomerase-like protein